MLAMLATGLYGVYVFLRIPRLMTDNMGEDSFDELLLRIADLDEAARKHALHLSDELSAVVMKAIQQTAVGGTVIGAAVATPAGAAG